MTNQNIHSIQLERRLGRIGRFVLLVLLVLVLVCLSRPGLTQPASSPPNLPANSPSSSPLEQAQTRYEAGDARAAVDLLEQALNQLPTTGTDLEQAVIQANLALAYQQLGQWQAANQAIAASLQQIAGQPPDAGLDTGQVLAQVRSVQGQIQLAQGQAESALTSWQQAETLYRQTGEALAVQQSQLNQAQALQNLGLYRRALALLTELKPQTQAAPLALRIASLRSMGEVLQTLGDLTQARQVLEQALQLLDSPEAVLPNSNQASLQIALANLIRLEAARQLSLSGLTAATALESLAGPDLAGPNLADPNPASLPRTGSEPVSLDLTTAALNQRRQAAARQVQQQREAALDLYQQAAQAGSQISSPNSSQTNSSLYVQAQLHQITVLIELGRQPAALALVQQIEPLVAALPVSQPHLYQQINLAQAQLQLGETSAALKLLEQTVEQAAAMQDRRTQSFGLGILGQGYQQNQDGPQAIQATQQALLLAQAIQAPDLAYRWQWQLGRLLNQQGQTEAAIAAYTEAVSNLQLLRQDLVAINRDLQFSFQAQVEPVYRELVDLLTTGETVSQSRLAQARSAIEALQIAELENFFQEACLDTKLEIDRVVDRARPAAAVFYT
ncbi:MAG: hypothetical protein ACKO7W_23270, partial [Elainella sp.]